MKKKKSEIKSLRILADKTLPNLLTLFPSPFQVTLYESDQEAQTLLQGNDILLCRSTLKVTEKLLTNSTIQCVATASSGIDHIDYDYLNNNNITLFDAKGCNANAVADYMVATIAFLERQAILKEHCVMGILGLGHVGSQVVMRMEAAQFKIFCYDPPKALRANIRKEPLIRNPSSNRLASSSRSQGEASNEIIFCTLEELMSCDVLCLHANLHEEEPFPSKEIINADFLAKLKPGATIINAARGDIVDEAALLAHQKPIHYCTDVFKNEPNIDPRIVDMATLCTPHIAGHSIEAKQKAVVMLSQKIHHHFKLPMPSFHETLDKFPILTQDNITWQDLVLSLYNPIHDTNIMKQAPDKTQAFLKQRKAHRRHEFSRYGY